MAKNKKQNEHQNDILENPEALAEQLTGVERYFEENKTVVLIIIAALLGIIGGYFGYDAYIKNENQKAQEQMFQAIHYFEADSLTLALDGDGINYGFKEIIDNYGTTKAANLANFYAGVSFLKQGDFQSAILYLENFSSDDLLIQARAYSLIGDAHMELEHYDEAAEMYQKAADYKSNKHFTPRYLMKAALAYEYANNFEAAKNAYDVIITEYWDSSEVQNAKKFKAKLEGSAS